MAGSASPRRDFVDDVVAAVAIDEQHARRSFQQCLRRRARAVFGEDVRDIESPLVVAGVEGPDEAVLGLAALVAHDAEPRLVGADHRAQAHYVEQPSPHRLEDRRRAVQELIHRRARDGDALTREGLLEAVDRDVVGALADGQVGEERRAVLTFLEDLRRAGRGDDEAVAATAQHLLYVLDAHEARGHEFPDRRLLALAKRVEPGVAADRAPAIGVGDFVFHPHSWGLGFGRRSLLPGLLPLLRGRRRAGLDARHLRLLAARAEHRLLQLRVLMLEFGEPIRQVLDQVFQYAVMIHRRHDHRPGLITTGDLCRSPCRAPDSTAPAAAR